MARRSIGPRLRFLKKRGAYYIVWTEGGRTRERSTARTDSGRFNTRDTVAVETPAAVATSLIVGNCNSRLCMAGNVIAFQAHTIFPERDIQGKSHAVPR